jgi:hypothetical protein
MHSSLKNILFLNLLLVLSLLAACDSVEGERKGVAKIELDQYFELLKQVDECLEDEIPTYTEENARFYELGTKNDSLILLVETYIGCGYTGSCGNRILLIVGNQLKWNFCGFVEQISGRPDNMGVKQFFLANRGYQTGKLKHRYDWNGESFDSKIISRNKIPWDILEQLPLDEKKCKSSYYDCFDVEEIELQEIEIGIEGKKGILISPRYTNIFKGSQNINGKEYWLFEVEKKDRYHLLNKFKNIEEIRWTRASRNGYYNLYLEEMDTNTYSTMKKEYFWEDSLYVQNYY